MMSRYRLNDFSNYTIDSFAIKPTLMCNMSCDYCYCRRGTDNMLKSGEILDVDVFKRVIESYIELLRAGSPNVASNHLPIVWHGGEPLIIGVEKFEVYLKAQRRYRNELIIHNIIQTNGTLINDEWVKLFKRYKVSVGLSVDGNECTHDTHRKYDNGKGSYYLVSRNIRKLADENIPFGTVGVLTERNVSSVADVCESMRSLGINYFDFTPAIFDEKDDCALRNKTYARFFSELFDYWKHLPNKDRPTIKIIDDIIASFRFEAGLTDSCSPVLCEFAGKCGNALAILPNGDVFPCECLINLPRFKLGNMKYDSLQSIIDSKAFSNFTETFNKISDKCYSCDWFKICGGGCFHRRLPECNGGKGRDYFCSGRKALFKYINNELEI